MYKFKSLNRNNIVYLIDKDEYSRTFYRNPSSFVSSSLYEYDTMGDGNVQHTPLQHTTKENCFDFLVSISDSLINCLDFSDSEIKYIIYEYQGEQDKDIEFLNNLKYKEGKITYFNLKERKKSTVESKRYDTRWQEIPEWYNGVSIKDIFTLHQNTYPESSFIRLINKWYNIEGVIGYGLHEGAEFFNLEVEELRRLFWALRIFRNILTSFRNREYAVHSLESLKREGS